MLKYLTLTVLTLTLFIIGFSIYGDFLMWTLPNINGLQFTANTFAGQFNGMIGFSLILALIPISVVLLWKYAPIFKTQRRILTVLIIFISIFLFGYIRHQRIINEATYFLQHSPQSINGITFTTSIPLESLNITTYMFFGLIAGCTISYFLLRESKISKQ